jgi:predicted dehydrogenase
MNSLIIGYGNAGASLHLPVLRNLFAANHTPRLKPTFHVFDNQITRAERHFDDVQFHSDIPAPEGDFHGPTVCHICTPPGNRLELIQQLLEKGHRYILVEKPVMLDISSLDQLIEMERDYSACILVVSVFSNSNLVEKIRSLIELEPNRQAWRLNFVQKKSRYDRSSERSQEHIFDIESPHQVALAVDLFGPAAVKAALTSHMVTPHGRVIPNMGTGRIELLHDNGVVSILDSSLVHPSRERTIELHTGNGRVFVGHFPVGRDDNVSTLVSDGRTEKILDEPLTKCISLVYDYFNHLFEGGPAVVRPALSSMALPFHRKIIELLDAAKSTAISLSSNQDNEASADTDKLLVDEKW